MEVFMIRGRQRIKTGSTQARQDGHQFEGTDRTSASPQSDLEDTKQREYIQRRVAWRESAEHRKVRIAIGIAAGMSIALPVLLAVITYALSLGVYVDGAYSAYEENSRRSISLATLGGSVVICLVASSYFLIFYRITQRQAFDDRLFLAAAQEELRQAESQVQSDVEANFDLDLSSLWNLTHKRLDYYHEIATRQAETSFRNAQAAMLGGFGLLFIAIVLSLLSRNVAASIATGLLGAVAAGVGGYISRTFLKSQDSAATHLRAYFLQPLEFSRYLVAERLLNTLPTEHKTAGILTIIEAIARHRSAHSSEAKDDKN